MFIDKDSIQIQTSGMASPLSLGKYLTEAKYGYNKLWAGNDSGRNLKGDATGTLIGIFVKIVLQFRPLNKTEVELLAPILDSARQSLTYYDPVKKANVTMNTYSGDYEITDKNIIDGMFKNEGFSCSFIAVSKRS